MLSITNSTTLTEEKQVRCIFCGEPAAEGYSTAAGEPLCKYCYDNSWECASCGQTFLKEDLTWVRFSEEYYCHSCLDRLFVECAGCGSYVRKEEAFHAEDGLLYCEDCAAPCYECGAVFETSSMASVVDENDVVQLVCQQCCDEYYTRCDHCDNLVRRDRVVSDGNTTLCESCYSDWYCTCEECGTIIHVDDAVYVDGYPYCEECAPRSIHEYSYEPPEFYFDGSPDAEEGVLYLGVELEVDDGYRDRRFAVEDVIDILGDEYVYCKYDGSLHCGFEIVTHPSTVEYHKSRAWASAFDALKSAGYKSHDAGTCGLHVHITRAVFSEAAEGRLLYLVEKFWPQLVVFSRRTEEQLDRWAARYGLDDGETPDDLRAKARRCGRYYAVNLTNSATIELRLFRGTLKLETFFATLEFAEYLAKTAINSTNEDVQHLTWEEFVKDVPEDYTYLRQYLSDRGLA